MSVRGQRRWSSVSDPPDHQADEAGSGPRRCASALGNRPSCRRIAARSSAPRSQQQRGNPDRSPIPPHRAEAAAQTAAAAAADVVQRIALQAACGITGEQPQPGAADTIRRVSAAARLRAAHRLELTAC
jgi:hypothetical protein